MGQNAFKRIPRLFFVAGRKCLSQPREALLICRMAWWVGFLSASARWLPLPRALELVSGGTSRQLTSQDTELPKRLARSIDSLLSANVLFFRPICWKRAAVLRRYLSQNGIATRILFGVKNESEGGVTGHAWLEADGKPILENTPPEYVVTYTFPSDENRKPQLATLSSK
jgi:hypothetical protein